MNDTKIAWTGLTWNPASGCEKVSEGCKFCYAEELAENKRGTRAFPNGFDLTIRPHKLTEPRRKKEPHMIFVNSMSDLFWEQIPDSYRHKVIDMMEEAHWHEYQVLTKRPEEMLRFSKLRKLPPNMWAGVTIESSRTMHRKSILQQVDADIRFISAEPLLTRFDGKDDLNLNGIHWIISGGESGLHLSRNPKEAERRALVRKVSGKWIPREDRIDWVRDIRDACIEQDVAFFHKQWGGPRPTSGGNILDGRKWEQYPRLPKMMEV